MACTTRPDRLDLGDPEGSTVELWDDLVEGSWQAGQQLSASRDWSNYAEEIWLTGRGLVVLSGRVSVEAAGTVRHDLGGRSRVFDGPPSAVYLPAGASYAVTAASEAEVAVCTAPGTGAGSVQVIQPGAVETNFSSVRFKGDDARAATVYQGYQALTADDVADAVLYCLQVPAHVTISDLTIYPAAQSEPRTIHRK